MDPKMIGEVGGDLLFTKLTRPHKAVMLSFGPSLFQDIDKGALLVCHNVFLEKLQYTVTRAVEEGSTEEVAVTEADVAASAAVGMADIVADTAAEEAQRAVDQR